jgi:hypothetical protein
VIATYLRRGLAAGLLAGMFAFGEPRLDRAVVLEEKADSVRAHDGAAPQHEGSGMMKLVNPPSVGDPSTIGSRMHDAAHYNVSLP